MHLQPRLSALASGGAAGGPEELVQKGQQRFAARLLQQAQGLLLGCSRDALRDNLILQDMSLQTWPVQARAGRERSAPRLLVHLLGGQLAGQQLAALVLLHEPVGQDLKLRLQLSLVALGCLGEQLPELPRVQAGPRL